MGTGCDNYGNHRVYDKEQIGIVCGAFWCLESRKVRKMEYAWAVCGGVGMGMGSIRYH